MYGLITQLLLNMYGLIMQLLLNRGKLSVASGELHIERAAVHVDALLAAALHGGCQAADQKQTVWRIWQHAVLRCVLALPMLLDEHSLTSQTFT